MTTLCWLPCAFLAPQTDQATLIAFYRRIRPAGPGWASVARVAEPDAGDGRPTLVVPLLASLLGSVAVYGFLFSIGHYLYGRLGMAALSGAIACVSGIGLCGCG